MKITINIDEELADTHIAISCGQLTPEIERLIATIRIFNMQLTGKREEEVFLLDAAEVLYVETVDKKTFLYTKDAEYESGLKLYELEEQLEHAEFVRINKSCLMNMRHVISLKADMNRRIAATMSNQERLMISRQYAEAVRERLGVK
ncbi:MAG: LytTR family DNA-binding domain-containing protein [Lachnospiraceae bacterium]